MSRLNNHVSNNYESELSNFGETSQYGNSSQWNYEDQDQIFSNKQLNNTRNYNQVDESEFDNYSSSDFPSYPPVTNSNSGQFSQHISPSSGKYFEEFESSLQDQTSYSSRNAIQSKQTGKQFSNFASPAENNAYGMKKSSPYVQSSQNIYQKGDGLSYAPQTGYQIQSPSFAPSSIRNNSQSGFYSPQNNTNIGNNNQQYGLQLQNPNTVSHLPQHQSSPHYSAGHQSNGRGIAAPVQMYGPKTGRPYIPSTNKPKLQPTPYQMQYRMQQQNGQQVNGHNGGQAQSGGVYGSSPSSHLYSPPQTHSVQSPPNAHFNAMRSDGQFSTPPLPQLPPTTPQLQQQQFQQVIQKYAVPDTNTQSPHIAVTPIIAPTGPKLPFPPVVTDESIVYMVQFKMEFRYFVASPHLIEEVAVNDFVICEAEKGEDLGIVCELLDLPTYLERRLAEQKAGQFEETERVLRHVVRVANKFDLELLPEKYHDETVVVEHSNEVVKRILMLPMQIVDAEYQFDRTKLLVYYSATTRVDFRELVSKLFSIFRTCIWLKKVNTNLTFEAKKYITLALRTGVLHLPTGIDPSEIESIRLPYAVTSEALLRPPIQSFVPGKVPLAVDFTEEEVLAQYIPDSDEDIPPEGYGYEGF